MNGQMKNYKKYLSSLEIMQEPVVPKAKIDMRGVLRFAKEKGVLVENLSKEEKLQFIQFL